MTKELATKGVSAAKWGTTSTLLRFLMQVGAQAALARILGPTAYGVFGVSLIIITMTSLLTDMGFSWNLLRKKILTDEDIQFAMTWQIIFGLALSFVVYFAADVLAQVLAREPVGWIIRLIAFSVVFNAAASAPMTLLSRELSYKKLGQIQVASYLVGYCIVGIALALMGYGPASLAIAWIAQSVLKCGLSFLAYRLHWRPRFRHHDYRSFIADGMLIFATNIVNWAAYNFDRVAISKLMPSHALGIYNVGANLASTPNSILLSSIQPIFMAAGAKLDGIEPKRVAYTAVLRAAILLVPPFYFSLAVCSPPLIHLLYGDKWTEAADVIRILFLGMPFFVFWSLSTPILWNTGKKHYEAILQVPIVALAVFAYFFASKWGIEAIAIAADGILAIRAFVMVRAASSQVGVRWIELKYEMALSAAFSAVAVITSLVAMMLPVPDVLRLLAAAALTGAGCMLVLRLTPYRFGHRAIGTVGQISGLAGRWLTAGRIL